MITTIIDRLNDFFIDHPVGTIGGPVALFVAVCLRALGVEALQDDVTIIVLGILNFIVFVLSLFTPRIRPVEIVEVPGDPYEGPDPADLAEGADGADDFGDAFRGSD